MQKFEVRVLFEDWLEKESVIEVFWFLLEFNYLNGIWKQVLFYYWNFVGIYF